MFLQRDAVNRIWGKASKTKNIAIEINGGVYYGTINSREWEVYLPKMNAGGPYEMTIITELGRMTLKDVYIGEVFLMSGQSNMEWQPQHSGDVLKEIYWINEHLRMRIFKLGRLQFQKREASEFVDLMKSYNLEKYIKRDYFYFVHIPEGERLSYDLVLDSYQKALDFFDDEMIFACESWMLSDRLELIFKEDSNILRFRKDYILLEQRREENHIKRYLKTGSKLLEKVESLEKSGIMIGEGFGICLKYIKEGGHYNG